MFITTCLSLFVVKSFNSNSNQSGANIMHIQLTFMTFIFLSLITGKNFNLPIAFWASASGPERIGERMLEVRQSLV